MSPRWIDELRAKASAQPRTAIDHWIQRQREIVLRLPRWFAGTWAVSSLAFGTWCAWERHGLMRPLLWLYDDDVFLPFVATIAVTTLLLLVVLYAIARVMKPRPPSSLPDARVRR